MLKKAKEGMLKYNGKCWALQSLSEQNQRGVQT